MKIVSSSSWQHSLLHRLGLRAKLARHMRRTKQQREDDERGWEEFCAAWNRKMDEDPRLGEDAVVPVVPPEPEPEPQRRRVRKLSRDESRRAWAASLAMRAVTDPSLKGPPGRSCWEVRLNGPHARTKPTIVVRRRTFTPPAASP